LTCSIFDTSAAIHAQAETSFELDKSNIKLV
jgi:hypothetical protein